MNALLKSAGVSRMINNAMMPTAIGGGAGVAIGGGTGYVAGALRQHRKNKKDPKNKKSLSDAAIRGGIKGGVLGGSVGAGMGSVSMPVLAGGKAVTRRMRKESSFIGNVGMNTATGAVTGVGLGSLPGAAISAARQHRKNKKDPKNKKSLSGAAVKGAIHGGVVGGALGAATMTGSAINDEAKYRKAVRELNK